MEFLTFGFGQEWPTSEFISKYNYQPVKGNFPNNNLDENNQLVPPMYPDGVEGINAMIKKEIIYPETKKAPKNNGKMDPSLYERERCTHTLYSSSDI